MLVKILLRLVAVLLPFVPLSSSMHSLLKETMTIPKAEAVKGYTAFTMVDADGDGPRPLEALCPTHCRTYTSGQDHPDMISDEDPSVFIYAHAFWSGEPWMYGRVHVCWGAKDIIWKIPLTSNVSSQWHCLKKNKLIPETAAMEGISLGLYTWYMRPENYNELRVDGHTEIVLPLLTESYQLPVHLMVFHQNLREQGVECILKRPHSPDEVSMNSTDTSPQVHKYGDHFTKFSFMVESSAERSGTYRVRCQGKDYYRPESKWFLVTARKEITLRFENVPRIEVAGEQGNTVMFPYWNTSGHFDVNVYSTSAVVAFQISRSDGMRSRAEILTEFLSHPYYSIVAQYHIHLPWIDNSVTGLYTLTASNEEGQSATQTLQLLKVRELVVLVNPVQAETGEAYPVSFQCLVLTDIPTNTSVYWEAKLSHINMQKGLMETKELSLSEGRKGVQLTLPSPSLSQSGHYACVAENRFERVEQLVLLTVFPPGVHGHQPHANGTWLQRTGSANALNASLEGRGGGGVDTGKAVAGVLGSLLVVGLVATLVAAGVSAFRRFSRPEDVRKATPQLSVWTFSDTEGRFEIINMDMHTQPQKNPQVESGDYSQQEGDCDLLDLELEPHTPKSTGQRKSAHSPSVSNMEELNDDGLADLEQDLHHLDSGGGKKKGSGRAGQKSKVRSGKRKS